MRCLCGHEGNDFVEIAVAGNYPPSKFIFADSPGKYSDTKVTFYNASRHYIYACPECGTLKVDKKK